MSTSPTPSLGRLRARLPELRVTDERRLRRRIDRARRTADPAARDAETARIAAAVDDAATAVALRRAAVPTIEYPAELPVSARRDDIAAAVRDHQVVIVAGETGSGKTTQLPKICLELGRGVRGVIGHTQPRRLAARTVADRIAAELGTELGGVVGYQVRFTDRSGDDTLVKLMTDGILLNEISHDRLLRRYDTLIIDEAHERSLNVDFILGYLKRLLPRRPDLKVIITSATIDPDRFSRHFDGAPVVEVSGRTYPVEVRYRPLAGDREGADDAGDGTRDQTRAIGDAVDELCAEGPGDILVFLSGEREIRDTADALSGARHAGAFEVLPLYARLSAAEQQRVFRPHTGRRVVLATNVAETSLTVPGISYVVDPGTARISRYSQRLKVQRLPIEPVSQASANQRKGRCGRTGDGVCIRLYTEEDFASRPEFTDPEIVRTNLASVILQMAALGLGEVADFPFIDPPDRRGVQAGVQLLHELGAFDAERGDRRLTEDGRRLARLPIDPRLARMVIEADRNGCAGEVMVLAAALSIQDPRERPAEHEQAADAKHARFTDEASDLQAYLTLWNYLRERQRELSSSAFRRMCKAEYLHYLRVREWQDLCAQLRQIARTVGITAETREVSTDDAHIRELVHRSVLAGLLSHIGLRDPEKRDYLGARGLRFAIFPGSALFKKPPRWVMAGELVETSRLWGRAVARIEPEWIESLAGHLVKRTYAEPHWEARRGGVVALERVTLYGVPIVAGRRVDYGRIDPGLCRELFIRHALVAGDWRTHHDFFHANRALIADVEELEHRARRRDILVDEETLFDFYDARIPDTVVSARHFDAWWKKARRDRPDLLDFSAAMLVNATAGDVDRADFPDRWPSGPVRPALTYQFEPGTAADGVTAHLPIAVLNQVDTATAGFDWQVPGLREQLAVALIRSLPKALRTSFVPAPDHAGAALARLDPGQGSLVAGLSAELTRQTGVPVPVDAWRLDRVPDHLQITFQIEDDRGRVVATGKDLEALRERLHPKIRAAVSEAAGGDDRTGLRTWSIGDLPDTVTAGTRAGRRVEGYPALVDEGETVAVRTFHTRGEQRRSMWRGTRRLVLLGVPSPAKYVIRSLPNRAKLALGHNPHGSVAALLADCIDCAADELIADAGGPAWDESGFAKLRDAVRADLADTVLQVANAVEPVLATSHQIDSRLAGASRGTAVDDIEAQLGTLIRPGFVAATGLRRLRDLLRYLRAVQYRLDKLPGNQARDAERTATVRALITDHRALAGDGPLDEETEAIAWMIEELRVSLFAQPLGTAYPISETRVRKAMAKLRG